MVAVEAVTSSMDAMAESEEGSTGESEEVLRRRVREDFAALAGAAEALAAAAARLSSASRRVADS